LGVPEPLTFDLGHLKDAQKQGVVERVVARLIECCPEPLTFDLGRVGISTRVRVKRSCEMMWVMPFFKIVYIGMAMGRGGGGESAGI